MQQTCQLAFLTTLTDTDHIHNLLASIAFNNQTVDLVILLLQQNGIRVDVSSYQTDCTRIIPLTYPNQLSLSAARNRLIAYSNRHLAPQYIMFLDDDSTYDASFFDRLEAAAPGNKLINVRYADRDGYFHALPAAHKPLSPKDYKLAISVNMILTPKTIERIGTFDERLGTGARYGAGEDNDYFIRALQVAPFSLCPQLYNLHPSCATTFSQLTLRQLVQRFNNYGKGIVFMLCKNKLRSQAIYVCIRALGGAITSLLRLRLRMTMAYFLSFFTRTYILFSSFFRTL